MNEDSTSQADPLDEASELSRREFLEKAGKLAAYTPPTMLALMYPGAHAVASGGVSAAPGGGASVPGGGGSALGGGGSVPGGGVAGPPSTGSQSPRPRLWSRRRPRRWLRYRQ